MDELKQTDIVKKLRMYTRHPMMGGNILIQQSILDEAADEIEKLRKILEDLRLDKIF